jgi:diguanylate cyclase (GGDEF)-like protein
MIEHETIPGEKLSRLSLTSEGDTPINVLLVEDSRTVRAQLRQYISMLDNVTLLEAETLAEARTILEARSHELFCAILDLTLPDANGLDTVEAVRAYDVPIIVLTGSADTFLRQAVLDKRVIDYMFKNGAAAVEDVAYLIGRLRQNLSMKVLVVDDSKTFLLRATGLLIQYRYIILTANNGREALEILEQNPDIGLVLTDYHMPEMNGLELVQHIRRQHRREDLAIIALSDINRPELSAAMLKAGANDYLSKKFQVEEFYCRVVQNTNMVRYVHELRDMANRDYLTRLHNRRYLFQAAEPLYAEARAGKRDLAVAMIDADHFKHINDEFGHVIGDEALKRIASVLRRGFVGSGIVSRYGGEEFVCVTTLSDPARSMEHFEQIREAVASIELKSKGKSVPLTVSIGVTTALGGSFADMIELADQAVYRAKAAGRNRVVELSPDNAELPV